MKVNLNNLLLISGNPRETNCLLEEIDGLGAADIRTSSFLFSGRDGGLITDQFYGFRNLSVSGKIVSPTCEQHEIDRSEFMAATPIGQNIPVYITTFAGTQYLINCRVIKPTLKYQAGGQVSDFLLQLTAGDPLFYSVDGGDEQTANVNRVAEGGYVTPYILPVEWELGGAPTIVNNSGNANFYPVITLNDEALNPVITNQATGESFGLDLSMIDGDVVIIDMYNRTVTLNGSDILGNKTDDSVWWALVPGNNPILLNTDTADDPITATLTWRNGVTGV